jgi:hypothetical protein
MQVRHESVLHSRNSPFFLGSAYVFSYLGDVWTQQSKLVASDGRPSDYFGNAVSNSGDLVAVGAMSHDVVGINDVGKITLPCFY